jgi:arsenite methyltransferase
MRPDNKNLRVGVLDAYSQAAIQPDGTHAFPVGRHFAENVGYSREYLQNLPHVALDAFAGVSAVSEFAEIEPGARVLDLGCGSGLDSLIAALRTGPGGEVIGVDFSEPMLARARRAALKMSFENISFLHGDGEGIPLGDASIDVALVNGIFNLNPQRQQIFSELARVVVPGGKAFIAELILTGPVTPKSPDELADWFA